jgi:hypothetical protein
MGSEKKCEKMVKNGVASLLDSCSFVTVHPRAVAIRFTWWHDAGGNLLAEADQNNVISRYYIHRLGLLAMVIPGFHSYCYHYDALGNTVALTDAWQ